VTALAAAKPEKRAEPKFTFYPPPPEPPRLQFLVSYSDEKDLGLKVSKFATFITGATAPSQPIVKPYGLALADNRLFVCDTATRSLSILDLAQKKMRLFGGQGLGRLGVPIGVALDGDGSRYIADTGRNRVLVFGPDEHLRAALGEKESARPCGVAIGGDRVYVTDLNGHCVRVYAKADLTPLFTIPRDPDKPEDQEPGKLFMPVSLAVGPQGKVYVTDTAVCRVQVYDAEGKHLRSIGRQGDQPGQFARPKGIAVDRDGRMYVVDAAAQVCQVFDAEGRLLLFFGEPEGSAVPLDLPAGICLDYDHVGLFRKHIAPGFEVQHLVLISNQLGERKISVYGLGRRKTDH
jgi:sugar lactone lactonase YvrE